MSDISARLREAADEPDYLRQSDILRTAAWYIEDKEKALADAEARCREQGEQIAEYEAEEDVLPTCVARLQEAAGSISGMSLPEDFEHAIAKVEEMREQIVAARQAIEAWEILRKRHWTLTWDSDPNPKYNGWEVSDSETGGWIVDAIGDPVAAVLAAKAAEEHSSKEV